MFSVGDKVIYGTMGVCTVEDIAKPDLPGGGARECYVLRPHFVANSRVYAPVEANPVKMRPLLSPEQAQSLIDSMPGIQALSAGKEKQEFYNTCRSTIKSTDSTMIARLLKTLYQKKQQVLQQKKLVPSAEKEYFDTAERMLFGEISVVLGMPVEHVGDYITARLEPGRRAAS